MSLVTRTKIRKPIDVSIVMKRVGKFKGRGNLDNCGASRVDVVNTRLKVFPAGSRWRMQGSEIQFKLNSSPILRTWYPLLLHPTSYGIAPETPTPTCGYSESVIRVLESIGFGAIITISLCC